MPANDVGNRIDQVNAGALAGGCVERIAASIDAIVDPRAQPIWTITRCRRFRSAPNDHLHPRAGRAGGTMIRAVFARPAEFHGQVGRVEVNAPQRGCHTNWSCGPTGRPTRRRIGVERPRELTTGTDQLGPSDEIRGSPSGNPRSSHPSWLALSEPRTDRPSNSMLHQS